MDGAASGRGGMQPPHATEEERQKKQFKHKVAATDIHAAASVCFYQQAGRDTSLSLPNHPQPQHEGDPSSTIIDSDNQKVLANAGADRGTINLEVQTQAPIQTRQEPTFMQMLLGEEDFELPPYVPDEAEDNTDYYPQTMNILAEMSLQGNNGIGTAQLEPRENMTVGSTCVIGSHFSSSQSVQVVEQDSLQITGQLNNDDVGGGIQGGHLAHLMSYIRAFGDPDQVQIPPNLIQGRSIEPAMTNHYAPDAEMTFSVIYPENTVIRGPQNVSGFSLQTYHSGQIGGLDNRNSEFHFLLEQVQNPENNSMRLINIRGHIPTFSVDPFGSRFIQKKLERATTSELVMVYEEIVPHVRLLALDVFANYAIQKAFEVSDLDLKIEMANERVLERCDDPDILKELISEIVEGVPELAAHQFGNYVVQHIVEHGGEFVRGMILTKLKGWIVQMSCRKYGSNVMEKCLTFGSIHDRLMIAAEIAYAGEEQILMVMLDQHGNYVIQKLLETTAEAEWVLDMMVSVANRNFLRLINYVNGSRVLSHLQSLLAARGSYLAN
ncbi:hypothetical protein E2562_030790 [Oryza meyeriana var. granulata]|uniref:PUM-HD domain-containing protein n=1 Tax=Oryza meyeriana var. granulata TaxID=110450 RepID=A0A6G1CAW4_9ORYZ|nr:hypothetical protein E2562_030790 [Oryza meyeriana var. granulata]